VDPVLGGCAQPTIERAATASRAGAADKDFFTWSLLGIANRLQTNRIGCAQLPDPGMGTLEVIRLI